VGKLPAHDVTIFHEWEVRQRGTEKKVFREGHTTKNLTLFPGLQFISAIPFEGSILSYYVKNDKFETVVKYQIKYTNRSIKKMWSYKQDFVYHIKDKISVLSAYGD